MGKFTDLSELVQNFPPKTSDDAYKNTYTIGDDIGTLVRVLIGYEGSNWLENFNWNRDRLFFSNKRNISKYFPNSLEIYSLSN